MTEKPLVSIIVPVYNAAKTLRASLESLHRQTYRPLEIVLVNDSSTDESGTIMDQFKNEKEKNPSFSVVIVTHEINKGVASSRNTGLGQATGTYIYYVDADDWIEDNTIESLIDAATKNNADITGHELWMKYEKERYLKMPAVADGTDAFQKMASGQLRWNLWLYLVKRSLYEDHNIRFLEGMNMGEDMMVMGKLFLCTDRIVIVHKPFYHYISYNPTSLTKDHSSVRTEQVSANINALEEFIHRQKKSALLPFIQYLKLQAKIPLLFSSRQKDYEQWQNWFPEANKYATKNRLSPPRTRILQYLAAKRKFALLRLHYACTNTLIKLFFH